MRHAVFTCIQIDSFMHASHHVVPFLASNHLCDFSVHKSDLEEAPKAILKSIMQHSTHNPSLPGLLLIKSRSTYLHRSNPRVNP